MKRIRSEDEIYNVLEKHVSKAVSPITAPELMEIAEVRDTAKERFGHDVQVATNKVSDTLGFMWRRGVLKRFTAPESPHYRARYAYGPQNPPPPQEVREIVPPSPSLSQGKPRFLINEKDDRVVIEFDKVTIIIKT